MERVPKAGEGFINYHTTTILCAVSVWRLATIANVKVQALPASLSIQSHARKSVGNNGVFSLSFGTFGVNKTDL